MPSHKIVSCSTVLLILASPALLRATRLTAEIYGSGCGAQLSQKAVDETGAPLFIGQTKTYVDTGYPVNNLETLVAGASVSRLSLGLFNEAYAFGPLSPYSAKVYATVSADDRLAVNGINVPVVVKAELSIDGQLTFATSGELYAKGTFADDFSVLGAACFSDEGTFRDVNLTCSVEQTINPGQSFELAFSGLALTQVQAEWDQVGDGSDFSVGAVNGFNNTARLLGFQVSDLAGNVLGTRA